MTVTDEAAQEQDSQAAPSRGPRRPLRTYVVGGMFLAALCFAAGAAGFALGERGQPGNDVDRGFLFDMATHHEQALRLANLELTRAGTDPQVQVFAREVLIAQSYELGLIDRHLADRGLTRQDRPPEAMAWMGMGGPAASMPGMATEAQLDALGDATGREADALFLSLLQAHHQGGIHMAEGAVSGAGDSEVRALAERIARNQRLEVEELGDTQARLGLRDVSSVSDLRGSRES